MTPAPQIAIYRFTVEQGRHIPVREADAGSAAGHVWQLNVTGGKFATVTLMRFFKIREKLNALFLIDPFGLSQKPGIVKVRTIAARIIEKVIAIDDLELDIGIALVALP